MSHPLLIHEVSSSSVSDLSIISLSSSEEEVPASEVTIALKVSDAAVAAIWWSFHVITGITVTQAESLKMQQSLRRVPSKRGDTMRFHKCHGLK